MGCKIARCFGEGKKNRDVVHSALLFNQGKKSSAHGGEELCAAVMALSYLSEQKAGSSREQKERIFLFR